MKKRIQFPLVELMLLIILLFILAIFALPKFLDVGSEARIKTLNATVLSLSSVNRMLYSRAVIKNVQNVALQSTDLLGEKDAGAYLVFGELRAQQSDLEQFINSGMIEYVKSNKQGQIRLYLGRYKNESCYIRYQQADKTVADDGQILVRKARYKIKNTGC